jgi:adenine phosphoribosyltransferase
VYLNPGAANDRNRMTDLKRHIRNVPDFPQPGILFRDIAPLLREHFSAAIDAMSALLSDAEWRQIDAVAGIESRGFILGAALAMRQGKGFVPIRKQGKLPPPVVSASYQLEYGAGVLEMQQGNGQLLLVDDVLATGGTLRASADLCLLAGYRVSSLAVLVDLTLVPDFRWDGLPARTVVRY